MAWCPTAFQMDTKWSTEAWMSSSMTLCTMEHQLKGLSLTNFLWTITTFVHFKMCICANLKKPYFYLQLNHKSFLKADERARPADRWHLGSGRLSPQPQLQLLAWLWLCRVEQQELPQRLRGDDLWVRPCAKLLVHEGKKSAQGVF